MSCPYVSVIIPVFNAVNFVEQAVNSAVNLIEVGEILLIDDGGDDGSFEKCKKLEIKFEKVKLLTHPGRKNKGVSASRNLGIIHSKYHFTAFLDADDYFLPNRFYSYRNYFDNLVQFDGIYEPVQYFNESDKIYGINRIIPSDKLTHFLIRGTFGHFHTNGLIIRRDLLLKAGLFVESLKLHQDSDLWLKLSFYGNLIPGKNFNKPVAMVRKHQGNRIWSGTSNISRYRQMKVTFNWAINEDIGLINKVLLLRRLIKYSVKAIFEK